MLFISGYAEPDAGLETLEPYAYLQKPFGLADLRQRVHALLSTSVS